MFVDWAGPTIPIFDKKTGVTTPGSLFVAALGASNYTYAQATLSQDLANWIYCHVRAFEYFQGAEYDPIESALDVESCAGPAGPLHERME